MELDKEDNIGDFCREINRIWEIMEEKRIDPEQTTHEDKGDESPFHLNNDAGQPPASPIHRQPLAMPTLISNLSPRIHSASTQIRMNCQINAVRLPQQNHLPLVKGIHKVVKIRSANFNLAKERLGVS